MKKYADEIYVIRRRFGLVHLFGYQRKITNKNLFYYMYGRQSMLRIDYSIASRLLSKSI